VSSSREPPASRVEPECGAEIATRTMMQCRSGA
jgi:hypothetical protein